MLATGGVILTSAGALMISRSLELVKPIEFTHMKIGTGDISSLDSARALTDLVASYKIINMSSIVRSENTVRIRGSFTNESFSNEVTIKEIGVFAKIGAEQSVLFGYVNDGQGEVIPPGNSGNVISRTRDLYIGVTSAAEAVITIDKSLVYPTIEDLEEGLNQKENKFNKNSGFNKPKSDATNLKDSETLATSMAVAKTMEKAVEAYNSAGGKEPAFNKNTAFNKEFGVAQNQVLEGSKLAEILGIEYGGVLNNANAKVAGKGYYDTANKKIYKCTANTSINYADSAYFEEISNNDLLGKLQNLDIIEIIPSYNLGNVFNQVNKSYIFGKKLNIGIGCSGPSNANLSVGDICLRFSNISCKRGAIVVPFISNSTKGGKITFLLDYDGTVLIDKIFDNTGESVQYTGVAPSFYGNISSLLN
ncbi:hypothetical protein [Cetobacterium sp.]|uniref:hypothetical protein n=1 Tax=Cetobacterium sp. TaxID=2071632 RepID=UPI003F2A81D9